MVENVGLEPTKLSACKANLGTLPIPPKSKPAGPSIRREHEQPNATALAVPAR